MNEQIEKLLDALSHRNRLSLLKDIADARDTGITVGAASGCIPVHQGTTSYHLRKMEEAGLLKATPDGRFRIYKINPPGFNILIDFLKDITLKGS